MNKYSSQSGVSLIEVLIYITILSFVMVGTLLATYQILSSTDSLAYKNVTEEEAGFIIAKINWALNDIYAINSPALPNTSSNTLSVNKSGYTPNPVVFTLSGDDITIQKSGGTPIALNSDRVAITNLNFSFIRKTGSSNVDSIKTSFYANNKYFEAIKLIK